jgi:MFS transporter, DHA2 family, multidrug resistance protein
MKRVVGSRLSDASDSVALSVELLASAVARQASVPVLAYIDGFQAAAVVAAMCWILAAFAPRPKIP